MIAAPDWRTAWKLAMTPRSITFWHYAWRRVCCANKMHRSRRDTGNLDAGYCLDRREP